VASAAAHQTMLSDAKLRAAFDFIDADADGQISKGAPTSAVLPCLVCMAHAHAPGNVSLRGWCQCASLQCSPKSPLCIAEDFHHMLTELDVDTAEAETLMHLAGVHLFDTYTCKMVSSGCARESK
jgi:hypothetical protein